MKSLFETTWKHFFPAVFSVAPVERTPSGVVVGSLDFEACMEVPNDAFPHPPYFYICTYAPPNAHYTTRLAALRMILKDRSVIMSLQVYCCLISKKMRLVMLVLVHHWSREASSFSSPCAIIATFTLSFPHSLSPPISVLNTNSFFYTATMPIVVYKHIVTHNVAQCQLIRSTAICGTEKAARIDKGPHRGLIDVLVAGKAIQNTAPELKEFDHLFALAGVTTFPLPVFTSRTEWDSRSRINSRTRPLTHSLSNPTSAVMWYISLINLCSNCNAVNEIPSWWQLSCISEQGKGDGHRESISDDEWLRLDKLPTLWLDTNARKELLRLSLSCLFAGLFATLPICGLLVALLKRAFGVGSEAVAEIVRSVIQSALGVFKNFGDEFRVLVELVIWKGGAVDVYSDVILLRRRRSSKSSSTSKSIPANKLSHWCTTRRTKMGTKTRTQSWGGEAPRIMFICCEWFWCQAIFNSLNVSLVLQLECSFTDNVMFGTPKSVRQKSSQARDFGKKILSFASSCTILSQQALAKGR